MTSSGLPWSSLENSLELDEALVILQMLDGTSLKTPLTMRSLSGRMMRLFLRSTRNPWAWRKSAPRIDCWTSARWKRQEYRALLMLRVYWRVPNDFIREPFAATRFILDGRERSLPVGGTMLTSAPVSIRKWAPDVTSRTCRSSEVGCCWPAERLFSSMVIV